MVNKNSISNEEIVAALLSNGTIKAAAAAAGISARSIYDRMNDGEFIALYQSAKADLLRSATSSLNSHIQKAIDTVAEIMQDNSTNAAIRLQAAQTVLNSASKFAERLKDVETDFIIQTERNQWI